MTRMTPEVKAIADKAWDSLAPEQRRSVAALADRMIREQIRENLDDECSSLVAWACPEWAKSEQVAKCQGWTPAWPISGHSDR